MSINFFGDMRKADGEARAAVLARLRFSREGDSCRLAEKVGVLEGAACVQGKDWCGVGRKRPRPSGRVGRGRFVRVRNGCETSLILKIVCWPRATRAALSPATTRLCRMRRKACRRWRRGKVSVSPCRCRRLRRLRACRRKSPPCATSSA